jgi:hypothetical protein
MARRRAIEEQMWTSIIPVPYTIVPDMAYIIVKEEMQLRGRTIEEEMRTLIIPVDTIGTCTWSI